MLADQDRIYQNLYGQDDWRLAGARRRGTWDNTKALLELGRDKLVEDIKESGLRGRGGAGFPTGMKWSFMPPDDRRDGRPHYLVVNADESEPGTCKDREILRYDPHTLIEGCLISGFAMGANAAYIYIRGEFFSEASHLSQAIAEAYDAGLIGKDACGSGWDFDVYLHRGAGAYICGEETALLESLEGKQGRPRFKPPFPANFGLYGKPTTINNTQSLASVPAILRNGAAWFASLGPEGSGGTALFSVSGHVERPGNYELAMGIPFKDLLNEICGGMLGGRRLKAVIPGGSSCKVLPAEIIMDCTMDYNSLQQAGSSFGTGAVIVMDETTCMVKVLRRISRFYMAESCGQCTPCREGTGWLYRMLTRIVEGRGEEEDLGKLVDVANKIEGHTICALGDAAAWPVQSFLKHYFHEFEYMVRNNGRSIVDDTTEAAA